MVAQVNNKRKKAKKQDREQDEVDRLEKENRELKAINRSLTKQLKKLAKGINKQEALEALDRIEETHAPKEEPKDNPANKCPSCGRNALKEVIVVGRLFHRCDICEYKSGRIK